MDNEKLFTEIKKELPEIRGEWRVKEIMFIHDPHPYCITEDHVKHAHKIINESALDEMEKLGVRCGMYTDAEGKRWCNGRVADKGFINRCQLSFKEHKSDLVLLLLILKKQSKTPKDVEGLQEWCVSIKPLLKKHKINGIGFTK